MTAQGWRKRQIMQWVPSEKKEQPEQKPVANGIIRTLISVDKDGIETWKHEPFYTSPPRREWVGLTEEEKESFWRADQMTHKEWDELFAAIEAKLREKNT